MKPVSEYVFEMGLPEGADNPTTKILVTFARLGNGAMGHGVFVCADPASFDWEVAAKAAREQAIESANREARMWAEHSDLVGS